MLWLHCIILSCVFIPSHLMPSILSPVILIVISLPASPHVLLQVFPVVVRTALSRCVPLTGGPIPVPVWLAVWDSRTTSLPSACAASVTPVIINPARGTRGRFSCRVRVTTDTTNSSPLSSDWQPAVVSGGWSKRGPLSVWGLLFHFIHTSSSPPTSTQKLQLLPSLLTNSSIWLSDTEALLKKKLLLETGLCS